MTSVARLASLVAKATPAAFKVLDAVCDALVVAGGVDGETRAGRAIAAFQIACDVRKQTKRRKRRRT